MLQGCNNFAFRIKKTQDLLGTKLLLAFQKLLIVLSLKTVFCKDISILKKIRMFLVLMFIRKFRVHFLPS